MSGCGTPPELLLPYVKAQLGVTWDDAATDERYTRLIADAMAYFDRKLGYPGDYRPPELREMVKERVRYARDGALDVFENNFQSQILALQNDRKVENYVSQMALAVSGEG